MCVVGEGDNSGGFFSFKFVWVDGVSSYFSAEAGLGVESEFC